MLERLLVSAFAPLLSAAPKPKKKTVAKRTAKPAQASKKAAPTRKVKGTAAKRVAPKPKPTKKQPIVKKAEHPKKEDHPSKPASQPRGKLVLPPAPVKVVEKVAPPAKPVAPAGRAILIAPENEKFTDSVQPTFRWLSVGSATRYEVAWSESPDLTSSHSLVSIATEATVPVEKPLRLGATYYWHVRGGNESGWGPWSATASFRVLEEPPA